MNFNDRIIANYESGVDDEYQAAIMHKSSTLAWHYVSFANLFLAGCLWIGGLYYNNTDATFATAADYVTGGLVGGVVGWSVMFWIQKRGRRQDEARLDAEYAEYADD